MIYKLSSVVYCTIELAGGWDGRIISMELYFSLLNCFSSGDITRLFIEQMFLTVLWSHSQYIPSTLLTQVCFCLRSLALSLCMNWSRVVYHSLLYKKHYTHSLLYSEEFSHELAISTIVLGKFML